MCIFQMEASEIKKPFLKWAGSKRKLIRALTPYLPPGEHRYVEPFVGAGAVFLNTGYPRSVLCDANPDLINLYAILKAESTRFIEVCRRLFTKENTSAERYYELRGEFNS